MIIDVGEIRSLAYRVILLEQNGTLSSISPIIALDDDDARQQAKTLVNGHSVDLWDGLRFVDHFPSTESHK